MKRIRRLGIALLLFILTACMAGTQAAPSPAVEGVPSSSPSAEPASLPATTPEPTPTPVLESPFLLTRVSGQVQAYPGPLHYEGDVLTFEVPVQGFREPPEVAVSVTVDGGNPKQVAGQWSFNRLLVPLALDTSGLTGTHEVRIQTADDSGVDVVYPLEVLPADQRPQNEIGAMWESIRIPCCTLHYITDTAAARDLETIADHAQQAAEDFARVTGVVVQDQIDVYIVDRMWGNGAFAGGDELLMAYTDRYYGPTQGGAGLETVFRHEYTHATRTDRSESGFFPFNEGLAVYIAGGHYKPEPIPERGAAMLALGYEAGLDPFASQHEIAYLHGATIMAYMIEEYGWDEMIEFGQSAAGDRYFDPEARDQIFQDVFGVQAEAFESSYLGWLASHEPGEQLDDLRLTVALQDLRREYQREFAPEPFVIFGRSEETFARPAFLPILLREASAPPNVAVELMIANAQKAILTGEYETAHALTEAVRGVLESGEFTSPLAHDYASIALALSMADYEGLALDLQGDQAIAQATGAAPSLEQVTLQKVDGVWQIVSGG